MATVFLNGKLVGNIENPQSFISEFKQKRRVGEMSPHVTINYSAKSDEITILCDEGRAVRPYIIVEKGKSKLNSEIKEKIAKGEYKWSDLIKNGIVEFLDAKEEENSLIAIDTNDITEKTTHLEIDPTALLGSTSSMLPFQNNNLSSRTVMACAMLKQGVGTYATNYDLRMDTRADTLFYPQMPIAQTRLYKKSNTCMRPTGQNFVVAILSYEGFNMMDGIILNKASIDRGLGRSVAYQTYENEERRYPGGQKDRFEIPDPTISGYRGENAYRLLGEDGIVEPEFEVNEGDVIIGKTAPPRFLEEVSVYGVTEEKRRENSTSIPAGGEGIVDSVMVSKTLAGHALVKIKIRSLKIPELGDKFASRHGQKGVVGLILPQEDMPFTEDGITPDLIMNPHCIPSRMTAGHLIDMLAGKAGSMDGRFIDGTAFTGEKYTTFEEMLKARGLKPVGTEVLYDGRTGKRVKAKIFMGVVYFQRLHHMVSKKLQVRSRGPVTLLTHQPTEGKARLGGLRFGEMETNCLMGYGASALIKERLLVSSDRTVEQICSRCGMIAVEDKVKGKMVCPLCDSEDVHPVEMGYAFKLLLQEIMGLGVFPRLILKDKTKV